MKIIKIVIAIDVINLPELQSPSHESHPRVVALIKYVVKIHTEIVRIETLNRLPKFCFKKDIIILSYAVFKCLPKLYLKARSPIVFMSL